MREPSNNIQWYFADVRGEVLKHVMKMLAKRIRTATPLYNCIWGVADVLGVSRTIVPPTGVGVIMCFACCSQQLPVQLVILPLSRDCGELNFELGLPSPLT